MTGSQQEPEAAATKPLTWADLQDLTAACSRLSKSEHTKPCDPEEEPAGGSVENALKLSEFSALVYLLRTHGSVVGEPTQELPVEVTADGMLKFPAAKPPAFAKSVVCVRIGGVDDADPIAIPCPLELIPVTTDPQTVVAVRLRDGRGNVQLVSFVTNNYVADKPAPCSDGQH
ncbi:hypothetical protein [Nocardia barduliensis]|uniref:hypothetical protein n=1 Tax=Nocardia barduliensis TaxID=2736643 RepID=UPI001573E0DA|nr:hypothetical protein [Nocardia barduliensis]